MRRYLKKYLRGLVPSHLRARFKSHVARKFSESSGADVEIEHLETGIRCTINRKWSFLAPLEAAPDLQYFTSPAHGLAELWAIADRAPAGGVLFDIGAHAGLVSAMFCSANEQNRVFSFEPSPLLEKRLVAIRALNNFGDRMEIVNAAIGEQGGEMEMLIDPAGGFVQAQRFDHTMWGTPESLRVRVETIAQAAARLGIVPDYLKIDIESYEDEAIRGSLPFLRQHKPIIFLELHLDYLEQRQRSGRRVVEMLQEAGYRLTTCAGQVLRPAEIYDAPLHNINLVAQ